MGGSAAGKITIESQKGRLSEDEINRIVEEAERYKEEDEKMKKKVTSKNDLENLAYQIRNSCDDPKIGAAISDEDKATLKAKMDEFEEKKKELEELWKPIVMKAYQASG